MAQGTAGGCGEGERELFGAVSARVAGAAECVEGEEAGGGVGGGRSAACYTYGVPVLASVFDNDATRRSVSAKPGSITIPALCVSLRILTIEDLMS